LEFIQPLALAHHGASDFANEAAQMDAQLSLPFRLLSVSFSIPRSIAAAAQGQKKSATLKKLP